MPSPSNALVAAAGELPLCSVCSEPRPPDAEVCPSCGHTGAEGEILRTERPLYLGDGQTAGGRRPALVPVAVGVGAVLAIIGLALMLRWTNASTTAGAN